MDFKKLNNITGWVVFAISLLVYLSTMAPTASFWDCGEFISCSNELEVPHPPGAPFFLLLGRVFAMFASGPEKVAFMVNLLSVLASAFTILFTFWITTRLAGKMLLKSEENPSFAQSIVMLGAGAVGAFACAFSDSFWFNAVEAEVYAMSSFFTAIVFWAMLKWEARANELGSEKWLVLIAYLMGLSIGVHLLNLLTIPTLAFIYYFKKYDFKWSSFILTGVISVIILAIVQFGIILFTFDIAWWFEQALVGTVRGKVETGLGMPLGSGIAVTLMLLVGGLVYGLYYSTKKGNILLNVSLLSVLMIYLGLATYTMIPIRSNANPPIDENDPADVHTFLSYMKREQYGDFPILFGQYYTDQPIDYDRETKEYIIDTATHKYKEIGEKPKPVYPKRFFPRMWDRSRYTAGPYGYINFVSNKGSDPRNPMDDKPTSGDNMRFFLQYQIGHMYLRYFMWNFAGRESDVQDCGWESGLNFGRNAKMPNTVKDDGAKNHYFFIPLLLGLLGIYWQIRKDSNNAIVVGLLFFFTGFAILVYLNQPPMQPRERDYAFAGSFQTFAIWIGLAVVALYDLLDRYLKGASAYISSAIGMVAPILMLTQNYDDHSRAGNYVCPDSAYNLLNSLAPNAVLFTNGDNDTFPLWYAQEVEGVRTDVRVLCLSYVNTDWYINHMKLKMNESEPLPITLKENEYTGTMRQYKEFQSEKINVSLPVNTEQLMADKIINEEEAKYVQSPMQWTIPIRKEGGGRILMLADLLIKNLVENVAKQGWKRPVYFANTVSPSSFLGLEPNLRQEGLAYRIVPVKKSDDADRYEGFGGSIREDLMYENMVNKFKFRNLNNPAIFYDENTRRMLGNYYNTFIRLATRYLDKAESAEKGRMMQVIDATGKPVLNDKGQPITKMDTSNVNPKLASEYRNKAKSVIAKLDSVCPYKQLRPDAYLVVKMGEIYNRLNMKDKGKECIDFAIDWCDKNLTYYESQKLYYGKKNNELAAMQVLMNYYQRSNQPEELKKIEERFGGMIQRASSAMQGGGDE